jgi:hypothetical protein
MDNDKTLEVYEEVSYFNSLEYRSLQQKTVFLTV